MPDSFINDMEYIAKVILFTFILLSLLVIYKQKVLEGIILLTFCIQLFLIWLLIKKYDQYDIYSSLKFQTNFNKERNVLYTIGLASLFIIGIGFLFRGIAIAQHSIINYGVVESEFQNDIIAPIIIGSIAIVIFIALNVYINQTKKKTKLELSQVFVKI